MNEARPSIGFTNGKRIDPAMMTQAVKRLLFKGSFIDIMGRLGVHHVDAALLSGTMDGYIQPDTVQVMDTPWPDALDLASVIVHASTHLYQQRYPLGGLGLEVMACTVEWLLYLLLGMEPPPDMMNRLFGWLDAIYEDELDALRLASPPPGP